MISIVIVDDHPLMRDGASRLLKSQPDMRVMKELSTGREALRALEELELDILLLDLTLPDMNGVEIVRRAQESHPMVRIVVLSMLPADQHEERLLALGASAYIEKNAPPHELIRAVRAVAAGERYQAPGATARGKASGSSGLSAPHHLLTGREHQVFLLISQGKSVADIAAELDLTSNTISTHLGAVREKLHVRTTADIVRYAIDHKIV